MLLTGLVLFLFAAVGSGLVAFTHEQTRERIAANEKAALLRNLHQLIHPDEHDNDLLADTLEVRDPGLLGTRAPVTVYRAYLEGRPVAVILTPVAPDGYNGTIRLLVGIRADGTLLGVRVLSHHETPGLGDQIEVERSDWILGFADKSLGNPPEKRWAVKKDGGAFDQFTGATITPRAVVKAVKRTLIYFRKHREALFRKTADTRVEQDAD
ncbi:MAG TPA: electron transport complex subunit RsxG [Thiotrichales bacterium]|nr:electron transport complex subunit RsxG [Thiotrichales bacterium]